MLENPTRYDATEPGTSSTYVDQRVEYAVVGNGVGEALTIVGGAASVLGAIYPPLWALVGVRLPYDPHSL